MENERTYDHVLVNLRFLWAIFKFANCDKLPEGKVNIPLGQKVLSGFNHPFGGAGFRDAATIHNLLLKHIPPKKTYNTKGITWYNRSK